MNCSIPEWVPAFSQTLKSVKRSQTRFNSFKAPAIASANGWSCRTTFMPLSTRCRVIKSGPFSIPGKASRRIKLTRSKDHPVVSGAANPTITSSVLPNNSGTSQNTSGTTQRKPTSPTPFPMAPKRRVPKHRHARCVSLQCPHASSVWLPAQYSAHTLPTCGSNHPKHRHARCASLQCPHASSVWFQPPQTPTRKMRVATVPTRFQRVVPTKLQCPRASSVWFPPNYCAHALQTVSLSNPPACGSHRQPVAPPL